MERALRYEIETRIPELVGQVYPTNAPEGAEKPYLVYYRTNTDKTKTLEGYTDKQALTYMFSIMAIKYSDMKSLSDKVEAFLMSIIGVDIGDTTKIHVEDLKINNINETWESALGVNRGIIDFTIYY